MRIVNIILIIITVAAFIGMHIYPWVLIAYPIILILTIYLINHEKCKKGHQPENHD